MKKLRCANCRRRVRMSDVRCRSCCNRTPWWYIYIFLFVMVIFGGILYALNELMKGAGLVSRVNGAPTDVRLSVDARPFERRQNPEASVCVEE